MTDHATPLEGIDFGIPLADNALAAAGLLKAYNRRIVVNHASLAVTPGEVVGLLGPNGAGKTTIFYMIAGVIRPEEGQVFLAGDNITHLPMHRRARRGLGYLPQERSVFRRLTVEQNLLAVLEQIPLSREERFARMETGLEELGLQQIRTSLGYQLSGGEARRLEIARALVLRPSFVLLDEPFAGVDPIAVLDIQEVIAQIRNRGIGVLITDHNVRETLHITDRAYIINQGEVLVHGVPDDLVNNEIARKIYLGEQFTL
ncbi:MAG TPA: LPS export ABC transporter ATP-binding protein [bacterium]|nr:LPS export ABC transporter ATP-binding protein [bacterium]